MAPYVAGTRPREGRPLPGRVPRDLNQRRSLKFGQRLLPPTSRYQIAFAVRTGTHVLDQDQLSRRQIRREFDRIEAKCVGLPSPTNGRQGRVRPRKRDRPIKDAPVNVREHHLTPGGGTGDVAEHCVDGGGAER